MIRRSVSRAVSFAALAVTLLLSGCVVVPPLQTQSGRPEVTIPGVARKQLMNDIVGELTVKGFTIRRADEFMVIAGTPDGSFAAALAFGSRFNVTPEKRVTFTLIEGPFGVRVFATLAMVTNPGTGFEQQHDITAGGYAHQAQNMLRNLAGRYAQARPDPPRSDAGTALDLAKDRPTKTLQDWEKELNEFKKKSETLQGSPSTSKPPPSQ